MTALATIAAGLFAGAALYVTAAEHPGRMECGPAVAIREFGPSYRRAAVTQVLLAVAGCGAGVAAWARGAGGGWLVGALLLGALIPFTLLGLATRAPHRGEHRGVRRVRQTRARLTLTNDSWPHSGKWQTASTL